MSIETAVITIIIIVLLIDDALFAVKRVKLLLNQVNKFSNIFNVKARINSRFLTGGFGTGQLDSGKSRWSKSKTSTLCSYPIRE